MRVLITGGAGFIGSHLTRRLLADGHEVAVLDNESTGRRENVPNAADYTRADVTRPTELEPVFARGLDAVCHLAGQVSIVRSFSDPVADLRTNTEGTVNVLRMCLKYQIPRLVYASSMTVYGDTQTVPTPETEPACPDSYYGITKFAAERYVHSTAQRPDLGFQFNVTSLRMYSVYGPVQALDNPYQGILGIFLGHLLQKQPITIYGDGEQTRDFIYIDDIVDGWSRALNNAATYGGIFNLGSGRSLSINQLAQRTIAACGYQPDEYEIIRVPARPGEQRSVQADIARAKSILGWKPRMDFAAGLIETVNWARSAYASSSPKGASS